MDNTPLFYGVWIIGKGWLKDRTGRVFADPKPEMARAALRKYLGGKYDQHRAYVDYIDDAMIGLESVFLESEKEATNKPSLLDKIKSLKLRLAKLGG